MGYFTKTEFEILNFKAKGYSIEDTYIYFKDFISMEDLISIWEGDFDADPMELA